VSRAPDVDQVTRRFYARFQTERAALLKSIRGTPAAADRECYAALTLCRLMFVYFVRNGSPDRGRDQMGQLAAGRGSGGLFGVHPVERANPRLHVADEAVARLFAFFDAYRWRLDGRPGGAADEITPGILGHILEKFVNQQQMGTYYTGEDVTGYIARGTILPALLDAVGRQCPAALGPHGTAWRLLRDEPACYTDPGLRKGVDLPLPAEIAAGLNDISRRGRWDEAAPADVALPRETWRDHVSRRRRWERLRADLRAGKVRGVNDLITGNLDLARFAAGVIERCRAPDVLLAFFGALTSLSVLDPTCGSGAFLLAALQVLEPLYEACLGRMQDFLRAPQSLPEFRSVLAAAAREPNRRYFVRKAILRNNLYGVDIMGEAVEICKLRLLVELAAAADGAARLGPLPDLDNHIRAGDTLLGAVGGRSPGTPARGSAAAADRPFHWRAEFPEVLSSGGFDIVIGNPPYVEVAGATGRHPLAGFRTAGTGNLFAVCTERFLQLAAPGGRLGVIVPVSAVSTPRMRPLMRLLADELSPLHVSHFAVRPGKLFAGVDMNLSILVGQKRTANGPVGEMYSTRYNRWHSESRPFLFATLEFTRSPRLEGPATIPKLGSDLERQLLKTLLCHAPLGERLVPQTCPESVYYHSGGRYFRKCLREKLSAEYKELRVPRGLGDAVVCLLSSSLYYWFWIAISDCYHVTRRDIEFMPFPASLAGERRFRRLAKKLLDGLWASAGRRVRLRADGSRQVEVNFDVALCRPVLDEIDRVLAGHYGLSPEALEFVLSYDAKYRRSEPAPVPNSQASSSGESHHGRG
jgi:hypothetical protein